MGTNYYVEAQPPCPCCNRPYDNLHIGKSSAGWCFSLHVIPELKLNTLDDWHTYLFGKKIYDEYGELVMLSDLMERITHRSWNRVKPWTRKELDDNGAEIGPNGLVRHKVDNHYCIGHGDGTWDYIVGDFS